MCESLIANVSGRTFASLPTKMLFTNQVIHLVESHQALSNLVMHEDASTVLEEPCTNDLLRTWSMQWLRAFARKGGASLAYISCLFSHI